MTQLQMELKKMGISPKEWGSVLTDEDVLDEMTVYDETDEDEED